MKIERVVCADETHEVVLCSGEAGERPVPPDDYDNYEWVIRNDFEEWAKSLLHQDAYHASAFAEFSGGDAILFRRPVGALPRPESETPAVDPRDARIAELEAALAAERAVSDAQKARADRFDEALTIESVARAKAEAWQAGARPNLQQALDWQISALRIANCAVSAIEYLTEHAGTVPDNVDHRAALAGVELVLKALKEMQS